MLFRHYTVCRCPFALFNVDWFIIITICRFDVTHLTPCAVGREVEEASLWSEGCWFKWPDQHIRFGKVFTTLAPLSRLLRSLETICSLTCTTNVNYDWISQILRKKTINNIEKEWFYLYFYSYSFCSIFCVTWPNDMLLCFLISFINRFNICCKIVIVCGATALLVLAHLLSSWARGQMQGRGYCRT